MSWWLSDHLCAAQLCLSIVLVWLVWSTNKEGNQILEVIMNKAWAGRFNTKQSCWTSRPVESRIWRAVSFAFFHIIFSTCKPTCPSPHDGVVFRPDPNVSVQLFDFVICEITNQFRIANYSCCVDHSLICAGPPRIIYFFNCSLSILIFPETLEYFCGKAACIYQAIWSTGVSHW